ncbi:MAG: GAF domain-containing protein [Anaerolineales bacterium]|nr:MAG: GAF domain-containing protein [Anaerolineales bacterium]
MTSAQLIWMAGLFVGSITLNTGLLKVITDDKIERPNLVGFFINLLLSLVGAFFGYILIGVLLSVAFVLFNVFSYIVIFFIVKKRDIKAVKFGETLLATFKRIDLQISFILSEINNSKEIGLDTDFARPVRRTLRYIISELPYALGLDGSHETLISVLIPSNNKFKVVAYYGLENFVVAKMEDLFRYGPDAVSIAGHAMNQRTTVIINDLSDDNNQDVRRWVRVWDESKTGSILAYPIIRGVGSNEAEPMAVICVTSRKKNAFDTISSTDLLNYFAPKIEILQNCMDLTAKINGE